VSYIDYSRRVACVGSRRLNDDELAECYELGKYLAGEGYVVTTGGAEGADLAFAHGCLSEFGHVIYYLPWEWSNWGHISTLCTRGSYDMVWYNPDWHQRWTEIGRKCHPNWHNLSDKGKKYHARNAGIMIGEDEEHEIVERIYAYPSPDRRGGTEQSFRMAKYLGIHIVNMREQDAYSAGRDPKAN
jgi:hypothetical protein